MKKREDEKKGSNYRMLASDIVCCIEESKESENRVNRMDSDDNRARTKKVIEQHRY